MVADSREERPDMPTLSQSLESLNNVAHLLRGLDFVVHCNSGHGFEPIAAFNVKSVADKYLAKCRRDNPKFLYRVWEL